MPVSKNRKNHKQKAKAYKRKNDDAINAHKKFMAEQIKKAIAEQNN